MFKIDNNNIECYSISDLKNILDKAEHIYLWESGPLKYMPVYKLSYSGIWIQTNKNLLLRYNTFQIQSIGINKIGSNFGMSNLHGAEEMVYQIFPMHRKDIETGIHSNQNKYTFRPEEEDYVDYKENIVTLLQANGNFSEMERKSGKIIIHVTNNND